MIYNKKLIAGDLLFKLPTFQLKIVKKWRSVDYKHMTKREIRRSSYYTGAKFAMKRILYVVIVVSKKWEVCVNFVWKQPKEYW